MIARRTNTNPEYALLREAAVTWAATESIDKKLGEELIAAGREVVAAWHARDWTGSTIKRLHRAIDGLEKLVGKGEP